MIDGRWLGRGWEGLFVRAVRCFGLWVVYGVGWGSVMGRYGVGNLSCEWGGCGLVGSGEGPSVLVGHC